MMVPVSLSPAQAEAIGRGRFVRIDVAPGRSVLVGRADRTWKAYANVCRHRALPLDLGVRSPMSDDARFLACHQHGALYRLNDGVCVVGPCAGERLTPLAIDESTGVLLVEADF